MNNTTADSMVTPNPGAHTGRHNRFAHDMHMHTMTHKNQSTLCCGHRVNNMNGRVSNKCTRITLVPHISRMLCMESWGAPTSRVRQPMPLAKIGPIVEPHSMSLRMQNSCVGIPRLWASSLQISICNMYKQ